MPQVVRVEEDEDEEGQEDQVEADQVLRGVVGVEPYLIATTTLPLRVIRPVLV